MQGSSAVWQEEANRLHPFLALAKLSRTERAKEVSKHMLKTMPRMVAALVLMIENEQYTKTEGQAKDNPDGKFSNQLTLCNAPVFRLGECHCGVVSLSIVFTTPFCLWYINLLL
jgi:hypothetical protein